MSEIARLGRLSEEKRRLWPCCSRLANWQAQWHGLAERELFRMRLESGELSAARLPGRLGKIILEAMPGKFQPRFWRGRK